MPVHYVVIPFVFRWDRWVKDVEGAIKATKFTRRDAGVYIGRSTGYVSYLLTGQGQETLSLKDFMGLCNMFDLNPSDYFELGE